MASRPSPLVATVLYAVITVAMTWPLVPGLGRDIPWDLGDSILNTYILQWGADHTLALLGGDTGAIAGFWNANYFYPEPLTLAYSGHLLPQMLQALPVYAATGNPVLAYNTVFLLTFVLSGLGAFLFVRELTGSARAAFVAGVAFAFAPYRIGQMSHVQVLSSQWMPFALYGVARYFNAPGPRPLAGTVVALLANNLSCGYFLLYFPPFVAIYALWEMHRRGRWKDRRAWAGLAATAVATLALTAPFVWPYARIRALGFDARPMAEVARFSADSQAYATAHSLNRLWGGVMQAFPRAEGELFTGVLTLVLTAIAVWAWLTPARRDGRDEAWTIGPRWRRVAAWVAGLVAVVHVGLLAILVFAGRVSTRVAGAPLRVSNTGRTILILGAAVTAVVALSPRARANLRRSAHAPMAMVLVGIGIAWVLSLGPVPTAHGRPFAEWGPYSWLMQGVPGFDGLRVPARFAMIVALFLSCGVGCGVLALERRGRFGAAAIALVSVGLLAESTAAPLQINATSPLEGVVTPSGPLQVGAARPAIYAAVAVLPPGRVLVEFPFGVEDYELRYMLAAAVHRQSLVNGYSGGFPSSYVRARAVFGFPLENPVRTWNLLQDTGVTHVIVHEGLFLGEAGTRLSAWLRTSGASPVAAAGRGRLFAIPARPR